MKTILNLRSTQKRRVWLRFAEVVEPTPKNTLRAIFTDMAVTPRDAAAIILLKDKDDPKVFWVKRSPKLQFMGGYHAFPGGQLDKQDNLIQAAGCDGEESLMRVCAVR